MANPRPKRSPRTQFKPGKSGNPGGRPALGVDLVAILRQYLGETDRKTRRTRARQLIASLVDHGIAGDVKATMAILDRIHGKVQPDRPDLVDIGEVVAEVAARAERRKLELALLEKRVQLAGKALEGPDDKIDLAVIARRLETEHRKIDEERLAEATATTGMSKDQLAAWYRARDEALAPRPHSGFVELLPAPAPEVKPQANPPVPVSPVHLDPRYAALDERVVTMGGEFLISIPEEQLEP